MSVLGWLGIGKDIKDSADSIGKGVSDIINAAKGQLPPDAIVKLEEIKSDVAVKLETIKATADNAIHQWALDYEGRPDQVPKWLLIWRGIIRPAYTTFFFVQLGAVLAYDAWRLAVQHVAFDQLLLPKMPKAWWWMQGIILTFWFGGRVGEHLVEKLKGGRE